MLNSSSKILIASIAFIFTTNIASAQDPAFSQFYANPLYLNPAFAGTNVCPRVNLNYRDQWPGIGRTYVSVSVYGINTLNRFIGLVLLLSDRAELEFKYFHASPIFM